MKIFFSMQLRTNQLRRFVESFFFFIALMSLSYFSHAAQVTLTDEAAVWSLWHLHKSAGTRHESIIALCKKMQRDSPANSLRVVTKGIAGWHLLQMGEVDEATATLNAMLS